MKKYQITQNSFFNVFIFVSFIFSFLSLNNILGIIETSFVAGFIFIIIYNFNFTSNFTFNKTIHI